VVKKLPHRDGGRVPGDDGRNGWQYAASDH
jgi:hypothetical protein